MITSFCVLPDFVLANALLRGVEGEEVRRGEAEGEEEVAVEEAEGALSTSGNFSKRYATKSELRSSCAYV